MNTQHTIIWLFLALVAVMVGGCTPQAPTEAVLPTTEGPSVTETPSRTIEFTLKTAVDGRKIFYVGVGGDIDGIVNPDLVAQPGDTIHAVMLNGDGLPHDLTFPDFDAHTAIVAGKGQEADVSFGVHEIGTFAYYCTVAGHRQSGQEGKLIVSEP
jgi:nitrite reductase (NO-forming)